jgi:hypothetical protein
MAPRRDEFLSEDDLALRELSYQELLERWNQWLLQAQSTNDADRRLYSHGVFRDEPDLSSGGNPTVPGPQGRVRGRTPRPAGPPRASPRTRRRGRGGSSRGSS